ncbi:MAG: hypothetical protein CVU91_05965 [Firmicutes bacterium HGW-Firmicutes-16]|nr:MAG: hypothetical protein CVU91_05965 [Firmicutes bacterium HGW-Firmicutes-16]
MNSEFLRTEGISKKYGNVNALDNVSFSLKRGEILGLFGKNGSGKSTLLDIIALAAKPDGGQIFFEGKEVSSNLTLARRRIGYVPQEIALFEELTVRENLLCWSKLPGKKAKARAWEVAEKLNLPEIYEKKVAELSGGMKRRVNLAVALLGEPELMVLDEPFDGVDSDNTDGIEKVLKEMAERGTAQIVSGHSPEQMLPLIDKVMVLSRGEIIYFDDKEALVSAAEGIGVSQMMQNIIRGKVS